MFRNASVVLTSASLLLLAAGCARTSAEETVAGRDASALERVHRGELVERVLLTGQLEAARAEDITVPRLPSWQTTLKWIAEDGIEVKEGDRVAELDNSSFARDLEQKQDDVAQADQELRQKQAEANADIADKEFEVIRRETDLEKAAAAAEIPEELLSRREVEDRKLALEKARIEHQKAITVLKAARVAADTDRQNLLLALDQKRREISIAEQAISTMILHAPRDGILILQKHPWEDRKIQTGDPVWVGMPVASIPELPSMQVVAKLIDVDDGKVEPGMPAVVEIDAFPGRRFEGVVQNVSATAQETGRRSLRRAFDVIVKLGTLDLARMRPGYSVRVEVERARLKDVLLAPRSAVVREGDSARLRLASGQLAEVKLGACNATACQVLSGVDEGTGIATTWRGDDS